MVLVDWLLLILPIVLLVVMFRPGIRNSRLWLATVTPLASIIGSGFLVVAPLLGVTVGGQAPWAMLAIVAAAYVIGAVIRFNIRHAEALLESAVRTDFLFLTERGSNIALSAAYVISVAFYLRLLAAFVLRGFGIESEFAANAMTTVVLLFIGSVGWWRGLRGLERLEEYSVTIKLVIIAALLMGLGHYDIIHGFGNSDLKGQLGSPWQTACALGGMLLVVQGFETSRYLGAEYSADMRIKSMRLAQILAGCVYLAFAVLITPLLHSIDSTLPDETAIIDLAGHVSMLLPAMLVIAAVMSQFSAAVADTVGAGGLLEEETGRRISIRVAYPLIAFCAILLVWNAHIFHMIAFASRTFAAYYFLQALVAFQVTLRCPDLHHRRAWQSMLGIVMLGLAWIVVFAKPVV